MPAHYICSYVATRQEIPATCGDPARRTAGRSSTSDREAVHGGGERYEIRLEGHLDGRWSAWFDGLRLTNEADGTATLSGTVIDQSALHGLLQKVRDLGLPLVSVTQVGADRTGPDQPDTSTTERPSVLTFRQGETT